MFLRWSVVFLVLPMPAFAHLGHLGELAGHDHIVIGAALGASVLAGLLGALRKGADQDTDDAEEDIDDEDLQEA